LEVAVKVIDYFSDVFDIPYMLPKCDLLAVHEFGSNAMENWGLITYVVSLPNKINSSGIQLCYLMTN
jgi:aminopeptidase N